MFPENISISFAFGIIAGIFSVIAVGFYIVSILKGNTKPNRASWIIWNVTNIILLVSYFSIGARSTIFLPIIYVFSGLITLTLSFRYGFSKWSTLDFMILGIAGLSLIVWFITNNPLTALIMNLLMDAFAYLPTIKKSYYDPSSESKISWLFIFIGSCFNILAITSFDFGIVIYPIMMLVMNGTIAIVLYRKKVLLFNYEK